MVPHTQGKKATFAWKGEEGEVAEHFLYWVVWYGGLHRSVGLPGGPVSAQQRVVKIVGNGKGSGLPVLSGKGGNPQDEPYNTTKSSTGALQFSTVIAWGNGGEETNRMYGTGRKRLQQFLFRPSKLEVGPPNSYQRVKRGKESWETS